MGEKTQQPIPQYRFLQQVQCHIISLHKWAKTNIPKTKKPRPHVLELIFYASNTQEKVSCVYTNERNTNSIYSHNITPEKMKP